MITFLIIKDIHRASLEGSWTQSLYALSREALCVLE